MTNTKIKFVLIVEETSIPLRENDIRMVSLNLEENFFVQVLLYSRLSR